MAKLVSMKLDPEEQKAKYKETIAADRPSYPWGLGLNLDNDVIEKLGTAAVPMEVGAEIMVLAKAKVTSVSSNQYEGSEQNRSVSLQITDLCLEAPGEEKNAADVLYGSAKG